MAIWISWTIDIGRSLNSRDRFPTRKLKNRAPISCSPGPILSLPAISFELHTKTAEKDLEKCNFRNFGSSMTLTLDWVEVTLMRISGRGLPTYQIRCKSEKLFVDVWTDGRTHPSSNLLVIGRRWPKNWEKNEQVLLHVRKMIPRYLLVKKGLKSLIAHCRCGFHVGFPHQGKHTFAISIGEWYCQHGRHYSGQVLALVAAQPVLRT